MDEQKAHNWNPHEQKDIDRTEAADAFRRLREITDLSGEAIPKMTLVLGEHDKRFKHIEQRIDAVDALAQNRGQNGDGSASKDEFSGPLLSREVKSLAPYFDCEAKDDNVRIGAVIAAKANGALLPQLSDEEKAVFAESGSGAFMIPGQYATDLIERVLPQTKVRQLGATVFPMKTADAYLVGFADDGFTPAWRAEGAVFSDVTPTTRRIHLGAKSLAAQVTLTIEQNADVGGLAQQIETELARGMALGWDLAAAKGSGMNDEPQGLLNIGDINSTALDAAPSDYDFIAKAVSRCRQNDFEPNGYLMSARTDGDLSVLKDDNGRYLDPPAVVSNLSRAVSNNVPDDLGDASTDSAVIVGDWSRLVLGVRNEVSFQVDPYSSGSAGRIVIRCYMRGDVAVTHFGGFEIVTGVQASA